MAREFQHLSRSQFVLTYGPGSIIETKKGPRLIPKLSTGLGEFFNEPTFQWFEIPDVRLCKYIQKNSDAQDRCRIVALPSNAGLERQLNFRVYSTQIFPNWKICYGKKEGKTHDSVLFNSNECPKCKTTDSSVVRFVAACAEGHLDDVNWHYAVHKNNNCRPQFYNWITSGSSLANIEIECPDCGTKTNMLEIYKMKFLCSGRTPEKEQPTSRTSPYYTRPDRPHQCGKDMKITQRQSTSLRLAETITLLTIPKFDKTISRILQQTSVSAGLSMISSNPNIFNKLGKEEFIKVIKSGLSGSHVSKES